MKSACKLVVVVFLMILILGGCTAVQTNAVNSKESLEVETPAPVENSEPETSNETSLLDDKISDSEAESETEPMAPEKPLIPEIDYQVIKPDESKEIMVIMYHNLSDKNSEYGRTIESFKQDLERLYDMGFRTISMQDYIQNNIETEQGYTPVVLTFDDGHITNFNYIENDGNLVIDPDCVVGILNEFSETHPGFGRNAIFYLNYGNAFGQSEYLEQKLNYLLENGYEIGNHAFSHEDLAAQDEKGIQTALGKNALLYHELNPLIVMDSLALPYGSRPEDEKLRAYIEAGLYEDYHYENKAILAVGWKPYYPVYHIKYDHRYVNRVQSGDGDMQLTWWLDNYEKSPSKRFISDGSPDRISIPAEYSDQIDASKTGEKELFFYELESE